MTQSEKRDGSLLEVEIAFFESNREDLLLKYPNRYLLIHGDKVLGHFEKEDDAITEGVLRFGSGPFLVRRTGEDTPVLSAPALTLGILQCRQ